MVDGLAPRGRIQPRPIKLAEVPKPSPALRSSYLKGRVLDLRPQYAPRPVSALSLPSSFASTQTLPAPKPIASRYPIPSLRWLLAGGASAALLAGSVMGITHLSPSQFASQLTPARASAATKTQPISATHAAIVAATLQRVSSTQIQTLLNNFAAQAGTPMFLVVKDLKTGQSASLASDQTLTSASLYKLFVANGIYSQIDLGKISLSTPVPGTDSNVSDCLTAMITVSDNTCGEGLENMLGIGNYDATLAHDGYTHTRWSQLPVVTSAGDVALLLERLYNGTLLSPNSSDQLLNLLKAQRINNRLPQGLPAGTVIAHKTGDLDGYLHDAGIVYGPKTDYLVVMMSGPWSDASAAPSQFSSLSDQLYKLFNQ